MMRLWLSRSSEVPPREQLATQILLAILGEDLKPGQKLPSTRQLARRLGIHPNTVSAAYRDLGRRGWVVYRKGSGVYVPEIRPDIQVEPRLELDHLISGFFQAARKKGHSLASIQSRLKQWLSMQPPDHFLLIEPDAALRAVLRAEIEEATGFPVTESAPDKELDASMLEGAAPLFLNSKAEQIQGLLPPQTAFIPLHARSVTAAMEANEIPNDALIAVASAWPEFLRWARAVFIAAGLSPEGINFCDSGKPGWQRGLHAVTAVISETLTARRIPRKYPVYVFKLLSDASLEELRSFKEFVSSGVS